MSETLVSEKSLLDEIIRRLKSKPKQSNVILDKSERRHQKAVFSKRFSEISKETCCDSSNERMSNLKF